MLKDYQRLLVGLDLSTQGNQITSGARQATQQAIWLAAATGASLRFVHSIYGDDSRTPLLGAHSIVHEGLPEAGEAAFAEMLALARKQGIQAELVITKDRPWMDISKMVIRHEADLVIVGKRNEPGDAQRRLGSTAVKLLRKCPCPIWVVKPDHDLHHKHVLAATDLSSVGDSAVRLAAEISQLMQCELHVVHAWQLEMALQLSTSRHSDEEHQAEIKAFKHSILEHIKSHLPEAAKGSAKLHTSRGTPESIIGEALEHLNPDLLVMGSISSQGLSSLLIGSTAERMLGKVDCSFLAIKPIDFKSPIKL